MVTALHEGELVRVLVGRVSYPKGKKFMRITGTIYKSAEVSRGLDALLYHNAQARLKSGEDLFADGGKNIKFAKGFKRKGGKFFKDLVKEKMRIDQKIPMGKKISVIMLRRGQE